MAELITQSELARRTGKSQPYIAKLIKQGKLQKNKDNLLDYDIASKTLTSSKNISFDANREYAKEQKGVPLEERKAKAKKVTPKTDIPLDDEEDLAKTTASDMWKINLLFNKAKTAEKVALAKLRDIDVKLKEGSLLEADTVKKEAAEIGNLITQKLYNMVNKLAPLMVGIDHQNKAKEILESEVEIVLEELNRMSNEL